MIVECQNGAGSGCGRYGGVLRRTARTNVTVRDRDICTYKADPRIERRRPKVQKPDHGAPGNARDQKRAILGGLRQKGGPPRHGEGAAGAKKRETSSCQGLSKQTLEPGVAPGWAASYALASRWPRELRPSTLRVGNPHPLSRGIGTAKGCGTRVSFLGVIVGVVWVL